MASALGEKVFVLISTVGSVLYWRRDKVGLALATVSITVFLFHLNWARRLWQRLGIPGPPANLLLGNLVQLRKGGLHAADKVNFSQFKQTFGTYLLGNPQLLTKDLKVLDAALRIQFANFDQRSRSDLIKNPGSRAIVHHTVDQLDGERWEIARAKILSSFSDTNLCTIMPLVQRSAKRLCLFANRFAEQGVPFRLKDGLTRFTYDLISKAGFDMDTEPYTLEPSREQEFIYRFREVLSFNFSGNKNLLYSFFPNFIYWFQRIFGVDIDQSEHHVFFEQILSEMYEKRKSESPEEQCRHDDMLQMLINAEEKGTLSKEDLIGQCFVLIMAGSETTSTALEFTLYVLSQRQDIQDRVRAEVDAAMDESDELPFHKVKQLRYLDAVIKETLRFYPVVCRTNRLCTRKTDVCGIPFEPGMIVSVPIHAIHHDPDFYPHPEKFDPERFLDESLYPPPLDLSEEEKKSFNTYKFLTFGAGRRGCPGKRLADLEMKVALAYLLRYFMFKPGPGMPDLPFEIVSLGITKPAQELSVTPTLHRPLPVVDIQF